MSVARTRLCDFLADRGRQAYGSGDTGVQRLLEEQPDAADEEEIWEQEVRPLIKDLDSMKDMRPGQKPPPENSRWYANWHTRYQG